MVLFPDRLMDATGAVITLYAGWWKGVFKLYGFQSKMCFQSRISTVMKY